MPTPPNNPDVHQPAGRLKHSVEQAYAIAKKDGFALLDVPIDPERLKEMLQDDECGALATFEGWVRNNADGHNVNRLEYEAYESLAIAEGNRVLEEAVERFGVTRAACVHRKGALEIGDLAVWVGVSSPHRDEAFKACRYVIDEIKTRLPIWKKEHYASGDSGWVNCERCAAHGHEHGDDHASKANPEPPA